MARQKHFRLPDDVLERINHRDKEMYPTENVYITEAVRNFFKKEETEKSNHQRISLPDPVAWSGSSVYMEK